MIFKSSPEIFSTRSTQLRCLIKTSSKSKANNSVFLELNFEQRRANKANIILAKKMLAHSPIAGKYSVMLSARVVAAHFARHVRQYSTFFEIFKIEICFSREREKELTLAPYLRCLRGLWREETTKKRRMTTTTMTTTRKRTKCPRDCGDDGGGG